MSERTSQQRVGSNSGAELFFGTQSQRQRRALKYVTSTLDHRASEHYGVNLFFTDTPSAHTDPEHDPIRAELSAIEQKYPKNPAKRMLARLAIAEAHTDIKSLDLVCEPHLGSWRSQQRVALGVAALLRYTNENWPQDLRDTEAQTYIEPGYIPGDPYHVAVRRDKVLARTLPYDTWLTLQDHGLSHKHRATDMVLRRDYAILHIPSARHVGDTFTDELQRHIGDSRAEGFADTEVQIQRSYRVESELFENEMRRLAYAAQPEVSNTLIPAYSTVTFVRQIDDDSVYEHARKREARKIHERAFLRLEQET